MPRGFLVKRTRRCPASYRSRSRTRSSNAPDARSGDRSGSGAAVQSAFPSGPLPVWSAHVESALEAEADRRAQLPETEEQVREVLTPDSGFSCFFPPPPPLSPRNLTSRSPVKPVGTRLLDLHLHHHLHEEQELLEQPLFPGRCLTSSPVPGLPELPFLVSSTPPPVSASMERLLASSSRRAPPRAPGDPYDPSAAHLHLFPQLALVNQKRAFLEQEQRVNGHRHTGKPAAQKKPKVTRKLNFEDEVTTSPVLGLRIKKELPETRRPASGTGNRPLGEYICQLCREEYPDPVSLAQHKCSRIVRVEYRCPECDKVFSCPANLASHRRWHKPRPVTGPGGEPPGTKSQPLQEARGLVAHERPPVETEGKENELLRVNTNRHRGASRREPSLLLHDSLAPPHYDASLHYRNPVESCLDLQADSPPDPPQLPPQLPPLPTVQYAQPVPEEEAYECRYCGKKFRRQAYLKKHLAAHELASPNPSYGQAREATGGQSHVFLCHLCGARFPSVDIRDKHRLWHAMRDELLAGGLGGAAGLRPDGYRAQGADGGEREQQQQLYACKLCPSTFFSSPGLARHVDKSHCTENRQVMLLQMTVRP